MRMGGKFSTRSVTMLFRIECPFIAVNSFPNISRHTTRPGMNIKMSIIQSSNLKMLMTNCDSYLQCPCGYQRLPLDNVRQCKIKSKAAASQPPLSQILGRLEFCLGVAARSRLCWSCSIEIQWHWNHEVRNVLRRTRQRRHTL